MRALKSKVNGIPIETAPEWVQLMIKEMNLRPDGLEISINTPPVKIPEMTINGKYHPASLEEGTNVQIEIRGKRRK